MWGVFEDSESCACCVVCLVGVTGMAVLSMSPERLESDASN